MALATWLPQFGNGAFIPFSLELRCCNIHTDTWQSHPSQALHQRHHVTHRSFKSHLEIHHLVAMASILIANYHDVPPSRGLTQIRSDSVRGQRCSRAPHVCGRVQTQKQQILYVLQPWCGHACDDPGLSGVARWSQLDESHKKLPVSLRVW